MQLLGLSCRNHNRHVCITSDHCGDKVQIEILGLGAFSALLISSCVMLKFLT